MADHVMALLLAMARKLLTMDRATRAGRWQARVEEKTRRISGLRLGLVGFGRIAEAVAERARAFELDVVTYDPLLRLEAAKRLNVRPLRFDELLQTSDFISLHVPLSAATRHLISEPELRRMKRNAILINTARGAVVNEATLVRALQETWIAGAALDLYENLAMFDQSPNVSDHPLFHLQNVLLTPHAGACSEESLDYLMSHGALQAVSVLEGEWPSNPVNPEVTPRFPLRRSARSN
jgi:D-3-phosphoglycerate dehydrogenase